MKYIIMRSHISLYIAYYLAGLNPILFAITFARKQHTGYVRNNYFCDQYSYLLRDMGNV